MKQIEASLNISESKYNQYFFDGILSDPVKYFTRFKIEYVQKELKRFDGMENFMNQIAFRKACENNTLRVEILQRKGYKKVVFIAES